MERALAFQRLIDAFHLSHDQVAQRVHIERDPTGCDPRSGSAQKACAAASSHP